MKSFLKKCVFFLFAAVSVFSQSKNAEREQGLITADPFWRQALGGSILSLPSVQAQSAVVALDGGNIRAYSTSGTPMWNYSARGRISPFVTRSQEGTSYLSRTNGTLIAINRIGRELWRRSIGSPLYAGVVTGWDGRLFVPTTDKKILCYTASGTLLWTRTFESPFLLAPKLDHSGGIIFALENNEVYSIDPFGNARVWILSNTPSVLLSIDQQNVIAIYSDGFMEILGFAEEWYISAQVEERTLPLPRLPSAPLAAVNRGNSAAVVLDNGSIVFVSIDEKRILWEGDSHIKEFIKNGGRPEMKAEVFFDERGIYILSKNGATSFTHDGKRQWFTFLQNAAAIPAFGNDGVLYSGGTDWILYAYKIEDRTLPTRGNLYGSAPEGSYRTGIPQSSYMRNFPLFEHEKRNMLEEIETAITAGRVGSNEPVWTSFLLMISESHDLIQLRLNALHLLGRIGSRETVPWLVNIFHRENEPVIKSAAAAAIGAIGVDPDGIALQAFLYTLVQRGIKDEQVLISITSATGQLCRFSGPPLSETGIRILNLLCENYQPSVVRRQANMEIESLR
jgi:outer membrane protein assembly factor BamB